MNTSKHTPGPWIVKQGFKCTDIVDAVTGEEIGYIKDFDNAVKVAAAPAMYEALRVLLKAAQGLDATAFRGSRFPGPEPAHEAYLAAYDKAKAALAQAEGGAK